MYSVVVFECTFEVKSIPTKFIKGFDPVRLANDAIDQSQTHIVFFSKNFELDPDFSVSLKDEFDDMVPACYKARILKFFSEYYFN